MAVIAGVAASGRLYPYHSHWFHSKQSASPQSKIVLALTILQHCKIESATSLFIKISRALFLEIGSKY